MILHRLIEIHYLENRCIKSGKKLIRNNNKLQRIVRLSEMIKNLCFLITVSLILLIAASFIIAGCHNYRRLFRRHEFIQLLLIHKTTLTVIYNNLSFVSIWLNLSLVMIYNVLHNLLDSLTIIHDRFHCYVFRKFSSIFIR